MGNANRKNSSLKSQFTFHLQTEPYNNPNVIFGTYVHIYELIEGQLFIQRLAAR
jgi:hypothetical protein